MCKDRAELSSVLPQALAHSLTGSSPQWQPWAAPSCQRCRCRRVYLESNEETRLPPIQVLAELGKGCKSNLYTLLVPVETKLCYVTALRTCWLHPGQIRSVGHMEGMTGYCSTQAQASDTRVTPTPNTPDPAADICHWHPEQTFLPVL